MKGQIETDTEKNMPLMNERKNKGKIEQNKNQWRSPNNVNRRAKRIY